MFRKEPDAVRDWSVEKDVRSPSAGNPKRGVADIGARWSAHL